MELHKFAKKIEPFIAIGVFILLLVLAIFLYQDNQLKKVIGKECGWEKGEDYYCYCDKGFVTNMKIKIEETMNPSLIIPENVEIHK